MKASAAAAAAASAAASAAPGGDGCAAPETAAAEVRGRDFVVHVLNDATKDMASRARVISDWTTQASQSKGFLFGQSGRIAICEATAS